MKRCPNCHQSYSDDLVFCLSDGTVLETTSGASYSGDMQTRIITPFPTEIIGKKKPNKTIYAIIGAMTVVIVGLSAIVFYLIPGARDEKKESEKTTENRSPTESKSPNAAQTSPTSNENKTVTIEKTPAPALPITAEATQRLINRWEQAQNDRNFKAYRSCYDSPFLGIKRTTNGGEERMNYTEWMNDRQKMLKNIIEVRVENLQITIENDTAIAQFIQQWQSVSYQETGQKTMRIKMFEDGAKIVYEELKYVY